MIVLERINELPTHSRRIDAILKSNKSWQTFAI